MRTASRACPAVTANSLPAGGMLTADDFMRRLRISRRTFYRSLNDGVIPPGIRFGRLTRWPTKVIDELESRWAARCLGQLK